MPFCVTRLTQHTESYIHLCASNLPISILFVGQCVITGYSQAVSSRRNGSDIPSEVDCTSATAGRESDSLEEEGEDKTSCYLYMCGLKAWKQVK